MKLFKAIILFLVLSVAPVFGEGRTWALETELNTSSLLDLLSNDYSSIEPPALFGVRYFLNENFGFETLVGMSFISEVPMDVSTETDASPQRTAFAGAFGAFYRLVKAESVFLDLDAKYRLTYVKASISVYDSSSSVDEKYAYYDTYFSTFTLSVQPTLRLSEYIELFTGVGLRVTILPNTKEVDKSDASYNYESGNFPMIEKKDSTTVFRTTGYNIGLRYFF